MGKKVHIFNPALALHVSHKSNVNFVQLYQWKSIYRLKRKIVVLIENSISFENDLGLYEKGRETEDEPDFAINEDDE